jgi:hypothetical protein
MDTPTKKEIREMTKAYEAAMKWFYTHEFSSQAEWAQAKIDLNAARVRLEAARAMAGQA